MIDGQSDGFAGKSVVVTGAGSGIGRAIAERLAMLGAYVTLAARTAPKLDEVAESIRSRSGKVLAVPTDITVDEEVRVLFDQVSATFGGVDVLVNNAGVAREGRVSDQSMAEFDTVLGTNLRAVFLCSQIAAKSMAERGGGKILNVGSAFGIKPVKGFGAYCASKAAVEHLTRVAALELSTSNIQVNAIAPGYVATELNASDLADGSFQEAVLRRIPARRIANPEELLPLIELLCSPSADYITGQTVVIDGGLVLR